MERWIAQIMSFQFSAFYLNKEVDTRVKMEADISFRSSGHMLSSNFKRTQIISKYILIDKVKFHWVIKIRVHQ